MFNPPVPAKALGLSSASVYALIAARDSKEDGISVPLSFRFSWPKGQVDGPGPSIENQVLKSGFAAAEVKPMAAKNKRVRSTQLRASQHREELLDEARSLMASGKVREARAVESRAGQVGQLVGALESDVRAEDADAGRSAAGH